MTHLRADAPFPDVTLPLLGGGRTRLGQPRDGHDWQMIVVYRGLHCPICKTYLSELDKMKAKFLDIGVDLIAVSADPEDKARAFADEIGLSLPVAYALDLHQKAQLGLYVPDPRSAQETDRPFAEPGHFVVNDQGRLQIADLSNAPFARPDLGRLAQGLAFVRDIADPVRGTRAAA